MAILLSYPTDSEASLLRRRVLMQKPVIAQNKAVRVALVGPGGFAKSTYVPIMRAVPEIFNIHAIVSRQGHNAVSTARQLGAAYATTDLDEVLGDAAVDAVMVTTRHDLHGGMVLRALEAGKHVMVEKPLCLTQAELTAIQAFYDKGPASPPLLMTGFNRRFSPFAVAAAQLLSRRSNPMIIDYRVNAGYLHHESWVHGPEGGGRNLGEACHFYDLFTFLTNATVKQVSAQVIRPATSHYRSSDNFIATLSFADGSLAKLTYTALGAKDFAKEQVEIYCDGKVISIDDYRSLKVVGAKHPGIHLKQADKGHQAELLAFAAAIRSGGEWPIALWQQVQSTEIALSVNEQIQTRSKSVVVG